MSKQIIISTLYRLPDSLVELFDPIEKLVSNIDQENKECIIEGDFNCDLWKTGGNNPKHIKRINTAYSFKQVIETPTRITSDSETLIDHVATNRPQWVSENGVIPWGISDHDIVYLIRSMCIAEMKKVLKIVTIRKCKNFNQSTFLSEYRGIKFNEIKNVTGDPNEMWLIWKAWFRNVLNKHAPVSDITTKGTSLPNITMEIKQLIRQLDYLRKTANKAGSPYLRQAFQQIRNKVTYSIRKARADYYP